MQLKIHRLGYFVEAVDQGSLAAAARRLNVAQPALSQQLGELEAAVGVALLSRGHGGVRPTEAGKIFYDHAIAILRRLDSALEETRTLGGKVSGDVAVLMSTTTSQIFLPWLIVETLRLYPDIRLHIEQNVGDADFMSALKSGRADFAILPEVDSVPGIESTLLVKQRLVVVGLTEAMERLQNGDGTIDFDLAVGLPLVTPRKTHIFRSRMEKFVDEQGKTLNVQAEASDALILNKYVETGQFYSILPEAAVMSNVTGRTKACPIVNPERDGHYHLFHYTRRPLSRSTQAVMDLLLEWSARPGDSTTL